MSLESEIKKLREAIAENTATNLQLLDVMSQSSNTAKQKVEQKVEEKVVTLADIRALARVLIKANRSDEVRSILAKFGAETLTEIDTKDYAQVAMMIEELG